MCSHDGSKCSAPFFLAQNKSSFVSFKTIKHKSQPKISFSDICLLSIFSEIFFRKISHKNHETFFNFSVDFTIFLIHDFSKQFFDPFSTFSIELNLKISKFRLFPLK